MATTLMVDQPGRYNPATGMTEYLRAEECVAYWAERYSGRGDGRVHYFARTAQGTVVTFQKFANPKAKLLTAGKMAWQDKTVDPVRSHCTGPYGMYRGLIQRSDEYPL